MRRREFISLLGGAAAWPVAARAQQPALPVVGFVNGGSSQAYGAELAAFLQGLRETGFREGQNVALEYRWGDGHNDRAQMLVAELVRRQPTVIAASGGTEWLLAVKAATSTIPIVFQTAADPIAVGLVQSLNRPGGNLTGVTTLAVELGPKRLELLHELVPAATIFAVLVNPTSRTPETQLSVLQAAARSLGLQLHILNASTERDFDTVFANLVQLRAGGLVIFGSPFFNIRSKELAVLALRHAVPTIYQFREFAADGGLMSYGGNNTDAYRLVGAHVGRILKGEKPADLPVQQSTKVELILNLKTAKALGLTVPPTLLALADDVIE